MKKLHQYMMILVAGVLSACGSMSVSDPYAEALPADFDPAVYMALHPELRVRQIKDFVADYNSQVKARLGANYDATKKADDAAFLADLNLVGLIYTYPQIGAHTAEQWTALSADLALPDTSVAYKQTRNVLLEYNFIDVADDFSMLLTAPVDYQAVSQQYNVFGRDHGWAYRACLPEEANNTPRSSLPIYAIQATPKEVEGGFVADPGYYCRDAAGIDRLIR
jgi:hypothetical protein